MGAHRKNTERKFPELMRTAGNSDKKWTNFQNKNTI